MSNHNDLPKNIGAPATRALLNTGIKTLKILSRFSESEITQLHGMGPKALDRLKLVMRERGISLRK